MRAIRGFWLGAAAGLTVAAAAWCLASSRAEERREAPRGWVEGRGWGWNWGPNDEVGALNAIDDASHTVVVTRVRHRKDVHRKKN